MAGAGLGVGVLLIWSGWTRPEPVLAEVPWPAEWTTRLCRATPTGLATWLVTGWPVAALAAAVAGWCWRPRRERSDPGRRLEAIAAWVELLRDTMAAAAGVEGAIRASARLAPEPIATEVRALADAIEHGSLEAALGRFAAALDDPTADLVVVALSMAARGEARDLRDLLGQLAEMARDEVAMRGRIEAERARTRTSVRIIVGVTFAFAAMLVLGNRGYFAPYDRAGGQAVLAGVLGAWAAGLVWLRSMASFARAERFLAGDQEGG